MSAASRRIPRAPLVLGLAGLLPFLWGALTAHLGSFGAEAFLGERLFLLWIFGLFAQAPRLSGGCRCAFCLPQLFWPVCFWDCWYECGCEDTGDL